MTTPTEKRSPMNRVKIWNGTVHFAEKGLPACGSAKRTHPSWMEQTTEAVSCEKCLKRFGHD